MRDGLASWFAIWHPRYRGANARLLVTAALTSVVVFASNGLLEFLTRSLGAGGGEAAGSGLYGWLGGRADDLAVSLPVLLLALAFGVRGLVALGDFAKKIQVGRLTVRSRDDLEGALLDNLVHKDDAFFGRHSPAETVNRLSVDLARVGERRPKMMEVAWRLLMMAANLLYLFLRDWRVALVPVVACVLGAMYSTWMARRAREVDADFLRHDDAVKSRFEDYLRAAPEIQVGGFFGHVRRMLAGLQGERRGAFWRFTWLRAVLSGGKTLADVAAFTAMIGVVIYMRKTGSVSAAAALVPVLIRSVPHVFNDASSLVAIKLHFYVTHTSMARLLEYEAAGPVEDVEPPAAAPAPAPLVIDGVTCRYAGPDGTRSGGVADVTTAFEPGRWTAVVGGAGSGKSTLVKLLLGRLEPQRGTVRVGDRPLANLSAAERAAIFALMPQSPAILDATLADNLTFGRTDATLSAGELDVVERSGLGTICRLKALDLRRSDEPLACLKALDLRRSDEPLACRAESRKPAACDYAALRQRARAHLREACEVDVRPYEAGHGDDRHWVLECLAGGRCDRERAAERLLDRDAAFVLRALARTTLGEELASIGRRILSETHHLLGLATYEAYARLAPFPLPRSVWQLRSQNARVADAERPSVKEAGGLMVVGLTSAPAELAGDPEADHWTAGRAQFAHEIGEIVALLGDAFRPFAVDGLHPYLSWRENLLFAVVETRTSRAARRIDAALLELADAEGLRDTLTRVGLAYPMGRQGATLSGGQRQLVALCRTLLRDTPVVILDEPTSALDPASRARVAELLRGWRGGRILITISHDAALVALADDVRLLDGGRLIASGTPDDVACHDARLREHPS